MVDQLVNQLFAGWLTEALDKFSLQQSDFFDLI